MGENPEVLDSALLLALTTMALLELGREPRHPSPPPHPGARERSQVS